jgi:hypothetical protein
MIDFAIQLEKISGATYCPFTFHLCIIISQIKRYFNYFFKKLTNNIFFWYNSQMISLTVSLEVGFIYRPYN